MKPSYDLVIRGGMVSDGSGRPAFAGDVAIRDGLIADVGEVRGLGEEELDASGSLVTPGFVDIHTHYDGHLTWGERLRPSSSHGVTTVVAGNCGVGFAPCRPTDHQKLVSLMEGVEDIPEAVLSAGLPWTWHSFPEYLNLVASGRYDMDVAVQVPHAPLRLFAMGERALQREAATPAEVQRMVGLAEEAIRAGAIGFSTSRSLNHKATDGTLTPSYAAASEELVGIARGVAAGGGGVLQVISDFDDLDAEFDILRRMVEASGCPLSFTVLQFAHAPDKWRQVLALISEARADGLAITGQVCGRPVGVLMGLSLGRNPFTRTAAYREVAALPLEERLAVLRQPARRRAILAEMEPTAGSPTMSAFANMYDFDRDGYEPPVEESMAARAGRAGEDPAAFTFDALTSGTGDTILYVPAANYAEHSTDAIRTMIGDEHTVLGLGDGGAHCGMICDASLPTWMLTRWSSIGRGDIPVEEVIHQLTERPARTVGLGDRGRVGPGYRADLNVIDPDGLALGRPSMVHDLPEGGGRLEQTASGYVATIVAGQVTYRHGVAEGPLPGRLVRGPGSTASMAAAGTRSGPAGGAGEPARVTEGK